MAHSGSPHQSDLKVMTPEGSDLVLATNIPDSEADILVLDRLHVEPCKQNTEPLLSIWKVAV